MMITAVIFDLDGVLIDSEPLHCMADTQLLMNLGIEVPEKYFDRFTGWTDSAMWGAIKTDYMIPNSIDELKVMQVPIKLKLLKEGTHKATPGTMELLKEIKKKNLPIAIASSSPRVFIEAVVEKIEIRQYFDVIVSGEEVERSKPEPDIFLKAAGLLKVNPSGCLVLEDSRSGTIAAKSAGMMCIGYQNHNSGDQDLSKADLIVNDLRSIDFMRMF